MSPMPVKFSPFRNEADALDIAGLKIENRVDGISIYGTLTVTRDKEGLAQAEDLKDAVDRIVNALRKEHSLPEKVAEAVPPSIVKNPFS